MSSSTSADEDNLYPHGMTSLSTACPAAHILDDLGGFQEVDLAGPSSFVRPTSLLFKQARERGGSWEWEACLSLTADAAPQPSLPAPSSVLAHPL